MGRLLVVDDEQTMCLLLSKYFSSKGYEVRSVQRGEEAIALTGIFKPDVVLLDLLMPGMSGAEILKAIKKMQPAPRVIMLSAADHEDVIKGALALGADHYACKPVNFTELEHLVSGISPSAPPH